MQIVVLDRLRILSRLRSRHVKSQKAAGKSALPSLLNTTINGPSIRVNGKSAEAKIAKARAQIRGIVGAFDNFENTYDVDDANLSNKSLVDLLTQSYEFDITNLQSILQSTPLLNPSLVAFLPQGIGKLRHYYCVACDLIDAARSSRYTIFGRVTIKVLDEPVVDSRSITNGLLDFDRALHRVTSLSHQRQVDCYGLKALSSARTKYHTRISSCSPAWKIHAEIQLLFFYEHNSNIPAPRIICSSKFACYLCNLFIRLHGRFLLPGTHGRL